MDGRAHPLGDFCPGKVGRGFFSGDSSSGAAFVGDARDEEFCPPTT